MTKAQEDRGLPDPDPQLIEPLPAGFEDQAQGQRRRSQHARSVSATNHILSVSAERQPSGTVSKKPYPPEMMKASSSTNLVDDCAKTGTRLSAARIRPPDTFTCAPVVENHPTALSNALSHRRRRPATPLVADQWEKDLIATHLLPSYPLIPCFIQHGAYAGIPHIAQSFTPPNKESTKILSSIFNDIIQVEFNKGRYLGPFSQEELAREIGPFQSLPLSLVPKYGKPGKYCLIQNLSYPHTNTPTPSINAHLNSDDFPCTWGTFRTICTLIRNLPQGSQAAVRDIAEAYRIIPLHKNQWPGIIVKISNNLEQFTLNTCNSFGCATAGGLFGLFGDALADILRANGIGLVLKWVDDFIFFQVPRDTIPAYNKARDKNQTTILSNGGRLQTGRRLWFKGKVSDEAGAEQFAEDLAFPIRHIHDYPSGTFLYPYDFEEIDRVTKPLSILWESSKDVPFSQTVPFIGFLWNLDQKKVELPEPKKTEVQTGNPQVEHAPIPHLR